MSNRANSYLYIKQIFHSDYFSGWDETELQRVLDNCENPSEAANPDAFCSDWLTFRGKGKEEGVQTQDDEIRYVMSKVINVGSNTFGNPIFQKGLHN